MLSSPAALSATAAHSRFVQRVRRRYAAELPLLPPGLPGPGAVRTLVDALAQSRPLPAALRVARQLVLERLALLDIEQAAPLAHVTGCMTTLAEVTLELALHAARDEADLRHGPALAADGRAVELWIVGMGKLGARELNVSSDIDLVYVYEEEGHTQGDAEGQRAVSFQEYFAWVAKRLYALIGEVTDDGFVFRVDLALRPNGLSGPPVLSLAMLEEYFQVQGREWERFAWLKSRVVAPRAAVDSTRALALRSLVAPFVYRRYLDYGVFESLRQLHQKVRDDAQRRAAGRPERANDVKLSRGGIREIEFIVQLLLVVRGGQFPELRTRSTLTALQRLAARGLMAADTAERLAAGYTFLRRVEHRIQYLDDQQTHRLPANDADLAWIGASMGAGCTAPPEGRAACALLERLDEVRELVASEFDALLQHGGGTARPSCRQCGPAPLPVDSELLLERLPPGLAERLRGWTQSPRVAALRDESRLRLGKLMQRAGRAVADGQCSEAAALRFVDWVDPLLRRESYLALLAERPEVQLRLLRLLGLARWPMQYLMRHPGVIDELADPRLAHQRFDAAALTAELEARRAGWQRSGEDDEEKLLDTLRHAHHAEVFRTLVRDVAGELAVEQVADDLSALADTVLETALRWCWARTKHRHRDTPGLAVIAYGKLGGKELGYGSDLDVVFLYDDDGEGDEGDDYQDIHQDVNGSPVSRAAESAQRGPDAQEVYSAFVRRLITWLTLRTGAGELFDIDTALRPNGNSGLLVTSLSAFERYQAGRGSNTAWTWEHQALTRARFCAGNPAVAARFEATRRAVLAAPRDAAALKAEVLAMRDTMRRARPSRGTGAGRFDLKHGRGGMVDVEFAVQALVLAHAHTVPGLLDNVGNIALLQRAEATGLLPPGVGEAAGSAYRALRHAQHRARLDEAPTVFEGDAAHALADQAAAVQALWRCVFGPDPGG